MVRRYFRPSVLVGHVLVLAAALTCLRLGWWQWGVAQATRGTAQNLGYALLWPVFAGAFIYMWLRFLHLESVRESEAAEAGQIDEAGRDSADAAGVLLADGPQPVERSDADPAVTGVDGSVVAGGDGSRVDDEATKPLEDPAEPTGARPSPRHRRDRPRPTETYTISVATVGDDDDDDPELAAYNRALAALAEQDERRAH